MAEIMMFTIEDRRAIELARRALQFEAGGDSDAAMEVVKMIVGEFGGNGLMLAILFWCDEVLLNAPGMAAGQPFAIDWKTKSGRCAADGPGEIHPRIAWAARLVTARAFDDQDLFSAVLATIPANDPETPDGHVFEVLRMAALNLQEAVFTQGIIRNAPLEESS